MSVFIVTGKLGQGKTLMCVDLISNELKKGNQVATNLDINVRQIPLIRRSNRDIRLRRLPDKPSAHHLTDLGYGAPAGVYDESQFGSLVLDECGTWLNSREWQEGGRRELLDVLIHIRKRGWNVYLIIQDISMLDKQIRKALAEHVVYCKRLDNIKMPILRFRLPKLHTGVVRTGDNPNAFVVDKWQCWGTQCYSMYDTRQVFREDYPHETFSYLPPGYLRNAPPAKRDWRFYMRLTHIYFRKYSMVAFGSACALIATLTTWALAPSPDVAPPTESQPVATSTSPPPNFSLPSTLTASTDDIAPIRDVAIVESEQWTAPNGLEILQQKYSIDGSRPVSLAKARSMGLSIDPQTLCRAAVVDKGIQYFATCDSSGGDQPRRRSLL